MDIKDIEESAIWKLYHKSERFMTQRGIYDDTNKNYRMYNGDQWHGLKIGDMEKVQYNIIKPIVKHKVTTITQNLFAINYSPENFSTPEFVETATKTCELLNKLASKVWDKDYMDTKIKKFARQSAINDEAVCYVDYNTDLDMPINEVISKNDIMYGNENEDEIQLQPYILIRQRKSVSNLREIAEAKGVSDEKIQYIIGDSDTQNASGEAAKDELEDNAWLITKLFKKDGLVYYEQATQYVTIQKEKDSGLSLYPVEHWNWEDVEGDARGIGEVKHLIPNQLELNKTAMRRAIAVKTTAYPQRVINVNAIKNKSQVNKVGSTIEFQDLGNTKASDVFMMTQPGQMSGDSSNLFMELMNSTRELAGAGDATTGSIDPESASGTAILAVQNAQNAPLNDQIVGLKAMIEGIARIWLEMWIVYAKEGLQIEVEGMDELGQPTMITEKVPVEILEQIKASVKVDITPRGAYDRYAQELSIQNLLSNQIISFEEYVNSLDSDSVMPKVKLEEIVAKRKEEQQKIAAAEQQAMMMEAQVQQKLATQGDIESIARQGQQMINTNQG